MSCPAPQSLVDLALGRLEGEPETRLHDHLDGCQTCLHVLAELVRNDGKGALSYPSRYRVLEEHGVGGQARVLRGFDTVTSREVALKEPLSRDGAPASPEAHTRFMREARITARLTHPGIVPIFDIGQRDDGQPFYSMQLVRGRTLAEAIRDAGSPAGRLKLLSHFLELCQAVAFAHHRGVVHRDIKPQNVVVGEFGQTVLLDWGLAKVQGDSPLREAVGDEPDDGAPDHPSPAMTRHGTVLGTPGYMSPEQAAGRLEEVDERSDVYGLGAVLHELLTGAPPPRDEHLGPLCPEAPRELAVIARKALARDRRERYERARDLAGDIQAYLTGERVTAYAYSAWELVRRLVMSYRRAATAIGLAVLALVASLVALAIALRGAERERHRALRSGSAELVEGAQIASLGGDPLVARAKLRAALEVGDSLEARALWWQLAATPLRWRLDIGGELHGLAMSPTERLAAVVGSRPGVRLIDLDTRDVRVASLGEDDALMSVSFSGDGRSLATGAISGKARILDLGTSEWRVLPGTVGPLWQVRISQDGGTLFGVDDFGKLWVWRGAAPPVALPVTPRAETWDLATRPDGGWVAAVTPDGTASLIDVTAGREVHLACDPRPGAGVAISPDGTWVALSNKLDAICVWRLPAAGGAPALRIVSSAGKLAFSPDSRQLAGTSADGRLFIWDVASGELLRTIQEGDTTFGRWPAWTPDGREIGVIFLQGTVKLFTAGAITGQAPAAERASPPGAALALAVSPDGKTIASGGESGTILMFDRATGLEVARVTGAHASAVSSIEYSPDGRRLVTTGADGAVRLWELPAVTLQRTLAHESNYATDGHFSDDGRLVGAAIFTGVRIWDAETGGLRAELPTPGHWGFAKHEPLVVIAGGRDGTLGFWDLQHGTLLETIALPGGGLFGVTFMDDDRRVAAATTSGQLVLWDRRTRTTRELPIGRSDALNIRFDRDRTRVASYHERGPIRLLELAGGEQSTVGDPYANEVEFTPDGKELVTGSNNGTVQVWDLATRRSRWRGPLLRARSQEIFTHEGWRDLGGRVLQPAGADRGWRAALARGGRLAAESPSNALVCLATFDDGLELWTADGDAPVARAPLASVNVLVADDDGCLALTNGTSGLDGTLVRIARDGQATELARGASAFTVRPDGILVATGDRLRVLDRRGGLVGEEHVDREITAMTELSPGLLALGFAHGGIQLWRLEAHAQRARTLRDTPQNEVVRLAAGPPGVLAAAFSNGTVGLWSTGSGARLHAAWLHGTATHLGMIGHHLVAVTDVGRVGDWDLRAFFEPACTVMGEVWRDVPAVWAEGSPRLRAPPREHPCASR